MEPVLHEYRDRRSREKNGGGTTETGKNQIKTKQCKWLKLMKMTVPWKQAE